MTALRDTLTTAVLATSTWKRRQVGYPELARWRGAKIDSYERVFVGHSSISIATTRTKLIAYDTWPVTAGELARAYLRGVHAGERRRPPSARAPGFAWQAPIVCDPVRHRSLGYVDVVSAYWQLISCFGPCDLVLGTEVVPGKARWIAPDEVTADRSLRHAVVGSIFSNRISWYRYGQLVAIAKTSPWSNPSLKRHCMQVLHAVCGQLRRRGNLYAWLTDAAIVDADEVEPVIELLAREWRLASTLKGLGSGAVVNATTYAVGEKWSLNLAHDADMTRIEPRPFSNLKQVPGKRLQTMRKKMTR